VFSKFWNPLQASNAETYYLKDRVLAYTFYSFLAIVLVTVGNYFFRFTHASMPLIMDPWHQLWLPILSIVPYVIMVHLLAPVFKGRAVRNQKAVDALWVPISKYWNLFLTILSFTMLFGLLHGLILDTIEFPPTSLSEVICNATNSRWNGTLSFWIWLFAMSKFIELFDTVILVARGKPVHFLHWYHHVTVLLFTWVSTFSRFTPGWAFCTINCFVHSMMYDYYYLMSCKIRLGFDKVVTTVQISQMVVGIIVLALWSYFHLTNPASCPSLNAVECMMSGAVMYASYLFLFVTFYIGRYLKKRRDSKAEEVVSKAAATKVANSSFQAVKPTHKD